MVILASIMVKGVSLNVTLSNAYSGLHILRSLKRFLLIAARVELKRFAPEYLSKLPHRKITVGYAIFYGSAKVQPI